jgi:hypothetical protein
LISFRGFFSQETKINANARNLGQFSSPMNKLVLRTDPNLLSGFILEEDLDFFMTDPIEKVFSPHPGFQNSRCRKRSASSQTT